MIETLRKRTSPFLVIASSSLAFLALTSLWQWKHAVDKQTKLAEEAASYNEKQLPQTPLIELESGDDYSERVKGSDVLLVYLMRGCDACEKELRVIADGAAAINPEVKIYGVMAEDRETAVRYVQSHNITFPILLDKNGKLFKELGLKYFPTNFKLSGGTIKEAWFGFPNEGEDFLKMLNARRS